MGFMQKQIEYGTWEYGEDKHGEGRWVPHGFEDILESEGYTLNRETKKGWGGRMSANGYLDCTEWAVYKTKKEADKDLEEMYGDDGEEES